MANYGDTAVINKGVQLRLVDHPPKGAWSRSVCNGLAQIIVQSAWQAGTIKLIAKAEGLKSVTVSIESKPATLRAALPEYKPASFKSFAGGKAGRWLATRFTRNERTDRNASSG